MMIYLENASTIRRAPSIQIVVFSGGNEPLSGLGKLERKDAALVQIELILVGLGSVEDFDCGAFHTNRQPLSRRAVA